jgi:hypothetical protein
LQVRAVNAKGTGDAKNVQTLAAQEPTAPSEAVMVMNHDENVVEVSWTAESDMGSPIIDYRVYALNLRAGGGAYQEIGCTSDQPTLASCKVNFADLNNAPFSVEWGGLFKI